MANLDSLGYSVSWFFNAVNSQAGGWEGGRRRGDGLVSVVQCCAVHFYLQTAQPKALMLPPNAVSIPSTYFPFGVQAE